MTRHASGLATWDCKDDSLRRPPKDFPEFDAAKPETDFQLQQALLLARAMATAEKPAPTNRSGYYDSARSRLPTGAAMGFQATKYDRGRSA